jgi:N-acetylglutamate synthase-like GNAT family acetyltransferase
VRVAAIAEDRIIGVGAVVPQLSQLRACYVLREVCRQGVGEAIVRRLEGIARERGASSLTLDASLNAVSFYARLGYERIEQGEHLLSCEVAMPCVKMHKVL